MTTEPDDWRRTGQEVDLPPGTALVFKRYAARSDTWEHEHCVFCWAKFLDPMVSDTHDRSTGKDLTQGYTTTEEHPEGADWHWVCPACAADFSEEYGLRVSGGPSANLPIRRA